MVNQASVGPAGAGKTRTLRAVVDAYRRDERPVYGPVMSAEAADELATSANAGTFAEAGGNVQVRALGPVGPQGAHGAQPHLARLVNTLRGRRGRRQPG